jgi:hypothetical protein
VAALASNVNKTYFYQAITVNFVNGENIVRVVAVTSNPIPATVSVCFRNNTHSLQLESLITVACHINDQGLILEPYSALLTKTEEYERISGAPA